ncbi:MAG: glucose-1-phosphate adenylyltransferase [PVC group bacterium]|nr:glucose-1-phosphate adenylyltransferase [PVC group bacterium]
MKGSDCLVLILGGGRGSRLYPLTLERSKPAIGFAGKYRIIDIPISNSINSGFNKIFILTQFLAASLHAHILHTYRFDNFSKGFIEILSAEQSHKSFEWFQGTADAVRRVIRHIRNLPQKYILILSGDHLYKMDYRQLMNSHVKNNAELSIASIFVDEREATRMGIIDCNSSGQITSLIEKPKNPKRLKIKSRLKSQEGDQYLASMGVYLFNKDVLIDILSGTTVEDFGKHILPMMIKKKRKVYNYNFKGYWRDIGTVDSYYDASLDLIGKKPQFDLFDENWPLFSRPRFLPPSRIVDSNIINALISDGCRLDKVHIENSLIGLRSKIKENTRIKDSIIIGNDYYQRYFGDKLVKPYIGKGVLIERAIVDKNVSIGDFCQITDKSNSPDCDKDIYYVRDGITIIRRGVTLPAHTII